MTLVQPFDLYQYAESGVDRGGSPTHSVVRVFEGAVGTFVTPSAELVKEWFGESARFKQLLLVRNNLANNPLGQISVHAYFDLDEFPFLYVVMVDPLSTYNAQPFKVDRAVKAPRPGVIELSVLGLTRPGPDERVEMQSGVLVAISG